MGNTTTMDYAPLAASLAGRLRDRGTPEHIAKLFVRVPRHRFLPDVYWTEDRTRVDRTDDPATWLRTAYTDQALTTQRDDGRDGGMGVPTSSSSAPSVMARMLAAARIEPDQRVLEIGTGTGFNAALLAELLGSRNVTTIEVDQALAETARAALYTAGYTPDVVIGDGEQTPRPASVHRIIATCTVSRLPWSWLDQLRGRGRIVTPWSPSPGAPGGVLAALDTHGTGLAEGGFEGSLAFMWSRNQRRPGGPAPDTDAHPEHVETVAEDPRGPWLDGEKSLLLSLLMPDWTFGMRMEPGADEPHVWLASTRCSSWARVHADGRVEQDGERLLVQEARTTWQWWEHKDRPGVDRFGLTIDRENARQTVWLDGPQHALWTTHRQIT
ncbi:methyltransferase domain-containing protein [Nocardiopsis sp. EMB25]|uniref:rRNA adenine N-6-methyltransferase family protein n=1 Tax=Nocardiopsis sp. EMB25 TaxID=2835867 RepID=UPI002283C97A|nr:rRNA adenine N-6-methyltransferase family protein [Nocardiopsis sp. EMB25]MCY9786817.1 methyltransferase domain-containing protein [Nocardiopsis sp. EMB25]